MAYQLRTRTRTLSWAALLLGIVFLAAGWKPAFGASAEATSLLQQAKTSAFQLRRDTAQMKSWAGSQVTWESHAHQINAIKEHVNNSGKILTELHNARDGAEAWQQDAIDRITPMLQEMASNTEAIINHLNEHQGRTWVPGYRDYVEANAEQAEDLYRLISDYLDYGSAKSKTESLEKSLFHGE